MDSEINTNSKKRSDKKSRLSTTLLSNYLLGITLLKNIALKFSKPEILEDEFNGQLADL